MNWLFFSRMFLYLGAMVLPVYHPAVAVAYDTSDFLFFLVLVPLVSFSAFFLSDRRYPVWLSPASAVLSGFLIFTLTDKTLQSAVTAAILTLVSYGTTFVIFRVRGRGISFAAAEAFFLGIIYYRLLSFARSSEDVSAESSLMTVIVLLTAVFGFLIHSIILYLAAFPDRSDNSRKRKELSVFVILVLIVSVITAVFLPEDFLSHNSVFNEWDEEAEPPPRELGQGDGLPSGGGGSQSDTKNGLPLGERENKYPSDQSSSGTGGGSGMSDGQGQGGNSGGKQQSKGNGKSDQKLEGIPADQWQNSGSGGGSGGKQRAVMIIASQMDPVYSAEQYLGDLDPVKGFLLTEKEPLNDLGRKRFMETWKDKNREYDLKREQVPLYYLSSLEERVLAYRPVLIEPTVQDTRFHPFNLSYNAVSSMSISSQEDWGSVRNLSAFEKQDKQEYLTISADPALVSKLKARTRSIYGTEDPEAAKMPFSQRIDLLLRSMKTYQYEMGFDEDMNLKKVEEFIFKTKTGDCTEFSHSVALMARFAGIPSRVVTGYIASRDLQTPAHRGGLYVLRNQISLLKKFDLEELYLITTSHHHSWVQFYIPGYGWVDFESTAFAIPPKSEMNPNNMDVVIPLIEEIPENQRNRYRFPWKTVLVILGSMALFVILGLYSYRNSREFWLYLRSRRQDRYAVRALYLLLFMKLAARGYPLKPVSETPLEFSAKIPELEEFARLYNLLYFRDFAPEAEKLETWKEYRSAYGSALKALPASGFFGKIRSVFSLRGLYYRT